MQAKERIASCWIGPRINPLGHACISSFCARGFGFDLYTYEKVQDVPACAAMHDAAQILPRENVFVAHGGLETATEQFAYRYLRMRGGWVVDLDVLCNADAVPAVPIAFAEEKLGIINNAVLKFPPAHPAVDALLDYVATIDPVTAPWGTTGPLALTKIFGGRADLAPYQLPMAAVYPIHWREVPKMLFAEFADEMEARVAAAPFVHLWGSTLREFFGPYARPPRGSWLERLYLRYLAPALMDQLQPLDERAFRAHVQDYIRQNWKETLRLV